MITIQIIKGSNIIAEIKVESKTDCPFVTEHSLEPEYDIIIIDE